ncbi:hypothetical protein Misp01_08580 [Microtetraspora sp. NBRC 13810]|uniref:hypothetical protein n=1 Tax=Microtetraspora sp. NBRC 13810 TaxID=3030990 RepID=UPI0024A4CF2E|nr:hypothetical protein [Microtetraspora sp. NBRC 13810]GLW05728.1 hypothetical protein Misp01_08580 [Microtetraspora sp. NBRC 13810]
MIGGAVTPIAATALFDAYGSSTAIAVYVTALCLISFLAILGLRQPEPSAADATGPRPAPATR